MKRLARRLYRLALGVAIMAYALGRRLSRPGAAYDPAGVRRVLVLRLGLMGDGALVTPALRLLRDGLPDAEIDVLATPIQEPIFAPLAECRRTLVWQAGDLSEPRRALRPAAWRQAWQTVRLLREQQYDLVLSCYSPLGAAIALLSGAPHRFGYAGEAPPLALSRSLPGGHYDRAWQDAEYNLALARLAVPQSGALNPRPPMSLVVSADARRAVAALLPPAERPVVLVHPGATNGEAKRWPLPYWGELCRRLLADGAQVVISGGPEDRALAAQLREALGQGAVTDLAGRTTIPQLLALLERCDVLVSGDSGPMHLGVGLGRPVVAIFGPTNPAVQGPYDRRRAIVVRHPLPCSPCYRLDRVADCPLGHTLCQRLILPERVYHAVRAALAAQV